MQKFYMIYVDGKTGSTVKHLSAEAAKLEAERLAKQPDNHNRKVFVLALAATCEVEVTPPRWILPSR